MRSQKLGAPKRSGASSDTKRRDLNLGDSKLRIVQI